MPSRTIYPWKRYWVAQGKNPVMSDGYFVEPAPGEVRWLIPESNGVPLIALKDVPCLVLLGDVGMGKSTTVTNGAEELRAAVAGQQHKVLVTDLKRLSETQVERRVFGSPEFAGWLRGEHILTLFLDSMDECWRRIDELESILVGELQARMDKKRPPFFLRLTCRSAEWRDSMEAALTALFPPKSESEKPVLAYTLAPLSKGNVCQAAAALGLDGKALLERIAERDAQPLASHPITLDMLIGDYQERRDFAANRVELYERGCLRLCEDQHAQYGSAIRRSMTPNLRLAIASRLAALGVLTNRYLINGNVERPSQRVDVLDGQEACGYHQEGAGGESTAVDGDTVVEALQTGLFGERVDETQSWRHQSYAEFLAARYLAQCPMSDSRVAALLLDTTDNAGRLVPQLEETAGWLADMKPAVFNLLAASNADSLIRCDPTSLTDARRALLVDSYLVLVRRHEAPQLDWQLRQRFARLSHPGLVAQIGKIIADRGENALVREMAIEIAAFARCVQAAPGLVVVLLDTTDVFRVRKHAGSALEELANDEIRGLLKQNATAENLDDDIDDIKGSYLKILWPSHLSIAELLPLLTVPKRRNYFGAYRMFIESKLPDSLRDADMAQVVDWIREKETGFDILGSFGHFPTKVFHRALDNLSDAAISAAVLRLLGVLVRSQSLHGVFKTPQEGYAYPPALRAEFWRAVVGTDIDLDDLIAYGDLRGPGMLQSADIGFFVEECQRATTESERVRWRTLVFEVFDWRDATALAHVTSLACADNVTADILAQRTSFPLVADDRNWAKKEFQRQQRASKRTAPTENSVEDLISVALKDFGEGKIAAFWSVTELLQSDPKHPGGFATVSDLAKGDAWRSLGPALRQRILCGVPYYLEAQKVVDAEVWEAGKLYRPYHVVIPLLRLLFDEARESLEQVADGCWRKWAPVIIVYATYQNGRRDDACAFILQQAKQHAETELLGALERYLGLYVNDDSRRLLIWRLDSIWCSEIRDNFFGLLRDQVVKPIAARDIFHLLFRREPLATRQMVAELFATRRSSESCSVLAPVAGAVLLSESPEENGASYIEEFDRDPPLGKAVSFCLLGNIAQPKGWLARLPEAATAKYCNWLTNQFPGDPYDQDGEMRVGNVTTSHEMYDFRQALFESLVNRGSREACAAMAILLSKRPDDFWLGDILAKMRAAARRTIWSRPSPASLLRALSDSNNRLIRTAGDLQSALIESIGRFEAALHGVTPSLELWNSVRKRKVIEWDPKDETNLSNCLKRHFERDLERRGIISGREVEIRQRLGDAPAELVDVLVMAVSLGEDGEPGEPVVVVIEVKCSWNNGVLEDMERQLYERYLGKEGLDFGIYLVAYFTCDGWNRPEDRRPANGASQMDIEELRTKLCGQAARLSSSEKRVESLVIDARISPQPPKDHLRRRRLQGSTPSP